MTDNKIDSRATIDADAHIGENVSIGPYSVISAGVVIGDNSWVGPNVVINGPTRIGRNNKIYQFSSIGDDPQDKKYDDDEHSVLEIGDGNLIREYCSINRGTEVGGGKTVIGDDNWIMAYVHVAHDCIVGNYNVFVNNVGLAGHVSVSDYVTLGAFTGVSQFCHVGKYCFSAAFSHISKDIPPFLRVAGNRVKPNGLNLEGLSRYNFSGETIEMLRQAYKIIYHSGLTTAAALEKLKALSMQSDEVAELTTFIKQSQRGIAR